MLGSMPGGSEAIPALSATERSMIRINSPPSFAIVRRAGCVAPLSSRTAYGTLHMPLNHAVVAGGAKLSFRGGAGSPMISRKSYEAFRGGGLGVSRGKDLHCHRRRRQSRACERARATGRRRQRHAGRSRRRQARPHGARTRCRPLRHSLPPTSPTPNRPADTSNETVALWGKIDVLFSNAGNDGPLIADHRLSRGLVRSNHCHACTGLLPRPQVHHSSHERWRQRSSSPRAPSGSKACPVIARTWPPSMHSWGSCAVSPRKSRRGAFVSTASIPVPSTTRSCAPPRRL
jgi:hypothetical protein